MCLIRSPRRCSYRSAQARRSHAGSASADMRSRSLHATWAAMTQAVQIGSGSRRASDNRIIRLRSPPHLFSHYYILVLPPLFAYVRGEYGVSYTELGLALAASNIVSAAFQTPAGFLVG